MGEAECKTESTPMNVRPCDGETLSGDTALVQWGDDGVLVAVIDVLGHGPNAHELAIQLSGTLSKWLTAAAAPSPEEALSVPHESARGPRGAAAAVAWLNGRTLEGSMVGIGNVRCRQRCEDRGIQRGCLRLAQAIANAFLFRIAASRCASPVLRRCARPLQRCRLPQP